MSTLLARQAAAFRLEHAIPEVSTSKKREPPPSLLFSPDEARRHDAGEVAALARQGLASLSVLEPDVAAHAQLFSGPARDRETLQREENEKLSMEIRHLLLLLSPHLQSRPAQEVLEGLLHRYHVHRWNVEDVLAAALPYHDSPLFTRLLQGLHVKGNQRWSWLQTLKEKPASLVRSRLAKYCTKDLAVLIFIGETVMEAAKLQKPNRPLASFFASCWLDALASVRTARADMVNAALPPVLLLLRRPHLADLFHAALLVSLALGLKAQLAPSVHGQLLERIARQVTGEQGRSAAAALAALLQMQHGGGGPGQATVASAVPDKVVKTLTSVGSEALLAALSGGGIDCRNLLAATLAASLDRSSPATDAAEGKEAADAFVTGVLGDNRALADYAEPLAAAALQAVLRGNQSPEEQKAIQSALAGIAEKHPAAVGRAFRKAAEAAARSGGEGSASSLAALARAASPVCSVVPADAEQGGDQAAVLPVLQALAHKSSKIRAKAVAEAAERLGEAASSAGGALAAAPGGDDEEATDGEGHGGGAGQLLAGLVLQATEDPSVQVVRAALESEAFWSKHPRVAPTRALPVLESVLARSLSAPSLAAASVPELAQSVLLQDLQLARLAPLAVQCVTWLYGRADCSTEVRRRADRLVLPLLGLCAVGLESKDMSGEAASVAAELRSAVSRYCKASRHKLLKTAAKSSDALVGSEALSKALTSETATELCEIAFDRRTAAPTAASSPPPPLGGAACEGVAALLLAPALQRLASGGGAGDDAGAAAATLLLRCARACRQLAADLSRASGGGVGAAPEATAMAEACRALLGGLLRGLGAAAAAVSAGGGEEAERKHRKSKGGKADPGSLAPTPRSQLIAAVRGALCLVLDRPRALAAELRLALAIPAPLLRPALLCAALGAHSQAPGEADEGPLTVGATSQANAIMLLRSLVLKSWKDGSGAWSLDQSALLPILLRLTSAPSDQVRGALLDLAVALLEASAASAEIEEVAPPTSSCWDSPGAQLLRGVGLLGDPEEALPTAAWALAKASKGPSAVRLPGASLRALASQLVAQRAEVVQDGASVGALLSRFLSGASAGSKPSARAGACAFIAAGLSLASAGCAVGSEGASSSVLLLSSIPAEALVLGTKDLLRLSVDSATSSLRSDASASSASAAASPTLGLLALVAERLRSAAEGAGGSGEVGSAVESFARDVALPFFDSLSKAFDGGLGKSVSSSLAASVCAASAVAVSAPAGGDVHGSAVLNLFRLDISAATAAASAAPAAKDEDAAPAQEPSAQVVARGVGAALALAPVEPALICRLLAETPALKGKLLASPAGRAAAELLDSLVASSLSSAGAGAGGVGPLLVALARTAAAAAAALAAKKDAAAAPSALLHLLSAAAVASERLAVAGAQGGVGAEEAATACASLREVVGTAGASGLPGGALTHLLRCSGSLSRLASQPSSATKKSASLATREAATPALMLALESLERCKVPISAEALIALKGSLRDLWLHPRIRAVESGAPDSGVRSEAVEQGRIRYMLHAVLASPPLVLLLKQQQDAAADGAVAGAAGDDLFSSVARGAGLQKSLDFVLLLYVVRRSAEAPRRKPPPRKRRAPGSDVAAAVAAGGLDESGEGVVDGALGLLRSVDAASRYHCFGAFLQTLCALAAGLRLAPGKGAAGPRTCWGLPLVPEALLSGLGPEHGATVLDLGLQVAERFLAEHGLPEDLDELEEPAAEAPRSVASSLGHAAWAACATEALLVAEGDTGKGLEKCRASAREVRALLLRSLAVNHPATFLRSSALALQVPDHHPPTAASMSGDLFFADGAPTAGGIVIGALGAVGEALEDRRRIRSQQQQQQPMDDDEGAAAAADAGDEERVAMARCAPIWAAVLRHVCKSFLSSKALVVDEASQLVAWGCAEALCRFGGTSSPKPVLKFCFPAMASCIAGFASSEAPERTVKVAEACCRCLCVIVEQLERGILEKLGTIAPPLLDLASAASLELAGERADALGACSVESLRTLTRSVGAFLSPFLERLLTLTIEASRRPGLLAPLEGLARDLAERVPPRLLLPAVQAASTSAVRTLSAVPSDGGGAGDIDRGLVRLQRLASFKVWIFSAATPDFVSALGDFSGVGPLLSLASGGCAAAAGLVQSGGQLEDIPLMVLKRGDLARPAPVLVATDRLSWEEWCKEGTALRLNEVTAFAFGQLALRRDIDDVKGMVERALDWARCSQSTLLAAQATRKGASMDDFKADAEPACRAVAGCTLLRSLASAAPGIAEELLLPLASRDLASALSASRRCASRLASLAKASGEGGAAGRKRRRMSAGGGPLSAGAARAPMEVLKDHSFWWFDVSLASLGFVASALGPAASASSEGAGGSEATAKVLEQTVEALSEPCVDLLDIFAHLPPPEASPLAGAAQEALHAALVAIAGAAEGPKVKQLFSAILSKTRSDDVEVRLASVRGCQRVWAELGVQVVSGLSEVVMYASELMEDEDNRVEEAVRRLVKTIEECTGESLQDALKR